MNKELEGLLVTYDAAQEKRGAEALNLVAVYRSKFDDVLANHPGMDAQTLERAVSLAHKRWLLAQKKHPAIPPKV